MGRPSKRTPEVEEAILRRLSNGDPLEVICRDEDMPASSTWREWCRADESLDIAHGRARDAGYDIIAHRARETARGKGESTSDVQRDKLIIDTDFKLLAKWDPRRYGEATTLKHADADGEKIELDPVARATRLAGILQQIEKRKGGDEPD